MPKERSHTNSTSAKASVGKQSGFSLIEVILASSVFILLITAFLGAWLYGQEATVLAGNRVQAVLLSEEGLEAVRNIRDADFANLTDGTHGLSISGNQWVLSASSDTNGIFTRQITISSIGADRKEITSTVTWQQNPQRTGSVSATTYLTHWQDSVSGPPGGGGGGPADCTGPPSGRPLGCN